MNKLLHAMDYLILQLASNRSQALYDAIATLEKAAIDIMDEECA